MGYVTVDTLAVVRVLAQAMRPLYGREIALELQMKSGVIYPILRRLDRNGLVSSEWERGRPSRRPLRRYYQITPTGVIWLDEAEGKYQ